MAGSAGEAVAFGAVGLRARVLRDVSVVETTTELWGAHLASPVLVAPMGLQRLVSPRSPVEHVGTTAGLASVATSMIATSPTAEAKVVVSSA